MGMPAPPSPLHNRVMWWNSMSKLAHSNDETMQKIQIAAMFGRESTISRAEAFDILMAENVSAVLLPESFQKAYILHQWDKEGE